MNPISKSALVILLLCIAAASAHAQRVVPQLSPSEWKAQQRAAFQLSEKIFDRAQKQRGLLAQYQVMLDAYNADQAAPFRVIFSQYLSWYETYLGNYRVARMLYSIRQVPERDDNVSPLSSPRWQQRPAADAILALVKNRKAVFFNEAHNVPVTRTLTVELLARLRAAGFTHFAAETLYSSDTGLQARGYPIPASGFYTEEPIYAEMIRTAIKLGFKVVAYEATSGAAGDAREREQARNLYDRVFRNDPDARLVVNAGYAHIQKSGKYLDGSSMAEYFQKISRIEPFAIEQTMMTEHDTIAHDHPIYRAVVAANPAATQPLVFVDDRGAPWSLKKAYDVSVFFPTETLQMERPTWLGLDGLRRPWTADREICMDRFPCLVEARYADESDEAIPADRLKYDRIEHRTANPSRQLYLRPGKYFVTATDFDDHVISRRRITIQAPRPPTRKTSP